MLTVPRDWSGLTADWMTAALASSLPGTEIATVSIGSTAEGTNARATASLTYRSGSGPERVFVKRAGRWLHRLALSALGARETEASLAASGIDLPLPHPAMYAAAIDRPRLATIVVMEDVTLSQGCPNVGTRPLPLEEVADGLARLAALHARHWQRRLPAFVRPWRLATAWAPVAWGGFEHAHQRLRRLGRSDLVVASPTELERGFRGWARLAGQGPQTLLHGDPHPGNTYRLHDGRTGFYDWQLMRSGVWAHDVGYFLISSLPPQLRREHERDLLRGYLAALLAAGAPAPAYDDAWALYRRTPAFGLGSWLQTLAAGSFQPVEVCLPTIERFAAAYRDLQRP